ncbi:MAG: DUF5685 family protein, partial [Oscillospiraceae bacterium]|nr:DUF5685 family protein [Oscillospiraceae bacterium]
MKPAAEHSGVFGYIRPVRGELKVREFEAFRACYCGLCHALGRHYGAAARLVLNFDLVFLAMLLWEDAGEPEVELRRCPVSPLKRKRCCRETQSLERCAGYSVILTYWKLRDSVRDETFFKRCAARAALLFLRRAYKDASKRYARFDGMARAALDELEQIEATAPSVNSLDEAADKFARILSAASEDHGDGRGRALEQILYHTGRWIYIIDACDDLKEDAARNRFNPVAARFGAAAAHGLDEEQSERVRVTLAHSANLAGAALELTEPTSWTPVVRNILCLGMPAVCASVLSGERRGRGRILT